MRMGRLLWGAGLVAVMGLGAGCSHDPGREARREGVKVGRAAAEKAHFVDRLARLDQEQIALGRLAMERTSNVEVKIFAQNLIQDHQRHLASLRTLAADQSMPVSAMDLSVEDSGVGGAGFEGAAKGMKQENKDYAKKADKQSREFFEQRDELSALSGRDFDRAFIEQVKGDQRRGEKLTSQGLSDYRSDTQLALFLGRSSSVYHSHQQQAETLQGYIGD